MTKRIRRNLIVFLGAMAMYGIFIMVIRVWEQPVHILLLIYAVIFVTLYLVNRKNIWAVQGNYFYITGHYARARVLLSRAVGAGVKSPHSHLYYALLLMQEDKDAHEAFKYLNKAMEMSKTVGDERNVAITMATCHWMNGDPQAAIKTLEDIREKHEYVNTSALTSLGFLYLSIGDLDKALEISNLAVEDDGNYAAAWDNLGQIYYKMENFDKARNAFTHALSLKQTLADSNYFMGILSEKDGDEEAAKDYFRMAHISPIAFFNTITQEMADEKYNQYHEE